MAFKSEELVLALLTENGDLVAARSCGGTQKQCDALEFRGIVNEDKDNLKTLREVLENTLEKVKEKEKELDGGGPKRAAKETAKTKAAAKTKKKSR